MKQSIKEIMAPGHSWSYRWYRIRELWCLKTMRVDWLTWALVVAVIVFSVCCYLQFKEWNEALKTASPDTQLLAKMMRGMFFMFIVLFANGRRK